MTRAAVRILGGVTTAVGATFFSRPQPLANRISGGSATPPSSIIRVLAGRQFVQGTALLVAPKRAVLLAAVAVDVLHGASMLAAPFIWPQYRRAALLSAAMAGASAATGALILITAPKGQPWPAATTPTKTHR